MHVSNVTCTCCLHVACCRYTLDQQMKPSPLLIFTKISVKKPKFLQLTTLPHLLVPQPFIQQQEPVPGFSTWVQGTHIPMIITIGNDCMMMEMMQEMKRIVKDLHHSTHQKPPEECQLQGRDIHQYLRMDLSKVEIKKKAI